MFANIDPNWILAGLTAIYVIATIAICWANWAAASAAKKQTEEMRKQYLEATRARLIVRFDKQIPTDMSFVLKNIGNNDAIDVIVSVNKEFMDALNMVWPNNLLLALVKSKIHIAVGQEFKVFVGFKKVIDAMQTKIAQITVTYHDAIGSYNDTTVIDFSQYDFMSTLNRGFVHTANGIFEAK